MQDEVMIPLRELLAVLFRRKWSLCLIFFSTVFTAIFLVYFLISPGYGATAMLILNNGSLLTQPLRDSPPESDLERVIDFKTQQDILTSTRIAAEAAERVDLAETRVIGRVERLKMWVGDVKRAVGEVIGRDSWMIPWDPEAAAVDAVKKNLSTASPPDSNVIVLTYTAKDPVEAAATLEAIVEAHSEYYYGVIRDRADGIVAYLQKEFDGAIDVLSKAEQAILQFKLDRRFQEAALQKNDLTSEELGPNLIGITDSTRIQEELSVYVLQLEEELRLARQITNNEQRARLEQDIQKRMNYYLEYINELPYRELELNRLTRAYNIANENYMLLQGNLARARLVASGQTEEINLIEVFENPRVETTPISPKKRLIVILSAFMGAVLALTWAFVWEYLDHTLKSAREVEKFLKLRVIGSLERVS